MAYFMVYNCARKYYSIISMIAGKNFNLLTRLGNPVEIILGLFGFVNAAVPFSSSGTGTWLVLSGLLVGKPLGVLFFTWVGEKMFKLEIPSGMDYRHIATIGMIAALGFTVALFVTTAAFPEPGLIQDSIKMGALGSFAAAILSIVLAKILGIKPFKAE